MYTQPYLHIAGGKDAHSPMMLSFIPVGVHLPVYVHYITFLYGQLSERTKMIILLLYIGNKVNAIGLNKINAE